MRIADLRFLLAAALAVPCVGITRPAAAQAAPVPRWDAKVGFSYLATSGNSDTSSAGFDAAANREGRAWSLEANAAGVSATRRHRRTAESYNALARLKRRLRKRLQLTLGLRWERNRFAGLDARETADVSVLWEIRETPGWKVRALGGLSQLRRPRRLPSPWPSGPAGSPQPAPRAAARLRPQAGPPAGRRFQGHGRLDHRLPGGPAREEGE